MFGGFSAPFIHRPVATTLLMVAILLVGLVAYPNLPVAPLPQVDFPTISVAASLPGASPETMAASVAQPLAGAKLRGRATNHRVTLCAVAYECLAGTIIRDRQAGRQEFTVPDDGRSKGGSVGILSLLCLPTRRTCGAHARARCPNYSLVGKSDHRT